MEYRREGLYRIADRVIRIESLYGAVHDLCADYRCAEQVKAVDQIDFEVVIRQSDIELERDKSAREDAIEGRPVRDFPEDYLETLAVYRKIAERMPDYDTFLFHGSCVAVDGEGYLFTAKSGTGKSTHTGLWRELFGNRAVMVNDDKPLIRICDQGSFDEGTGALVYGTPWDGKHRLSTNICVPLRAICLLERAGKNGKNEIREITMAEALPMLLQQAYRPAAPAGLKRTLELIGKLGKDEMPREECEKGGVRFYRMRCNMEIEAAEMAYKAAQR